MLRFMVTGWVKDTKKAVEFYKKAFDAKTFGEHPDEDGNFYHIELDIYGQVFSLSEARHDDEINSGNVMVFCLHFNEDEKHYIQKAYDVLKEDAQIISPLGPCVYSQFEVDLIDKFGIRWCLFI